MNFRTAAHVALIGFAFLPQIACMSATHAEDPIPGAVQRSVVIADESGDGTLWVLASALLPLTTENAALWVDSYAGAGLWAASAGRSAPAIEITDEAPGWAQVLIKAGPFPGGLSGEEQADEVREAWSNEFLALRERVAGVPPGEL